LIYDKWIPIQISGRFGFLSIYKNLLFLSISKKVQVCDFILGTAFGEVSLASRDKAYIRSTLKKDFSFFVQSQSIVLNVWQKHAYCGFKDESGLQAPMMVYDVIFTRGRILLKNGVRVPCTYVNPINGLLLFFCVRGDRVVISLHKKTATRVILIKSLIVYRLGVENVFLGHPSSATRLMYVNLNKLINTVLDLTPIICSPPARLYNGKLEHFLTKFRYKIAKNDKKFDNKEFDFGIDEVCNVYEIERVVVRHKHMLKYVNIFSGESWACF
jgi:hypothetical protein